MISALLFSAAVASVCSSSAPEILLPDIISTNEAHESLNWISPQRDEIFFTRASADFSNARIYRARLKEGDWDLQLLSISSGPYDADFALMEPENAAIFTSTRPSAENEEGDWNLWRAKATRIDGRWRFDEVELLPSPINTEKSECCAVAGPSGDIYFSSDRTGNWDIYRASPGADGYRVEALYGAVNTEAGEWPNAIANNEELLLMSSIRKSGSGGDDIYASAIDGSTWSAAMLLNAPVNTPFYEDNARVFGETLYWSSRSSRNGESSSVSNIYYLPAACLERLFTSRD